MSRQHTFDRFRQPEYVGENRCLPCTAINLVFALIAAGIASVGFGVAGYSPALSLTIGAAVLGGCVLIVYLRGYLIPGTPTMTKRYLPSGIVRLFGKAPEPNRDAGRDFDVEATLTEAGALEACSDRDDLCLTPSFEAAWNSRMDSLSRDASEIRSLLEGETFEHVDPTDVTLEQRHDRFVASVDGTRLAQWPSRTAYLADIAAAMELRDRYAGWSGLGFRERTELAGSLRLWLDRCPACDGTVEMGKETVESCCRERQVIASSCAACGSRLFEADLSPGALEGD